MVKITFTAADLIPYTINQQVYTMTYLSFLQILNTLASLHAITVNNLESQKQKKILSIAKSPCNVHSQID